MTTRLRCSPRYVQVVVLSAAAIAASVLSSGAIAAESATSPAARKLEADERLYRKYCGQCHALRAARAVGAGSHNRLGENGGPSFDRLRVPFVLTVILLTQASSGHEHLYKKLTWKQIRDVSAYLAKVTKRHPIPSQLTKG